MSRRAALSGALVLLTAGCSSGGHVWSRQEASIPTDASGSGVPATMGRSPEIDGDAAATWLNGRPVGTTVAAGAFADHVLAAMTAAGSGRCRWDDVDSFETTFSRGRDAWDVRTVKLGDPQTESYRIVGGSIYATDVHGRWMRGSLTDTTQGEDTIFVWTNERYVGSPVGLIEEVLRGEQAKVVAAGPGGRTTWLCRISFKGIGRAVHDFVWDDPGPPSDVVVTLDGRGRPIRIDGDVESIFSVDEWGRVPPITAPVDARPWDWS